MRQPGTNEQNVEMSDVLCDFCHREWTEDVPMVEGHHGSCVCGRCVTVAYTAVVLNGTDTAGDAYECPMCLEGSADRDAMGREGEPGWQGPFETVICRRCIELAVQSLGKDKDSGWKKPEKSDVTT